MRKNWVAVASADHVRIGRSHGFMQVCHGKNAPLKRMSPNDTVVYYSPSVIMRKRDGFQSFTALGTVIDRAPYQASMHNDTFHPFRRDVDWHHTFETPIKPLLGQLDFTKGNSNWGYQLRLGLFEITGQDMGIIADAMNTAIEQAAQRDLFAP